jgi:hypothetical protein
VETEEDLDMIAAQNAVMKTAVNELYRVSADEMVRKQYEAREKAWKNDMARKAYAEKKGRAEARIADDQRRIADLERQLAGRR